jgi:hypothetical protein
VDQPPFWEIPTTMNGFDDEPGFMAYGGGYLIFEVLHADWPIYPTGHGWQLALKALASFPSKIRFREIDSIDRCSLLVAVGSGSCLEPSGNLFEQRWFHVAVWHTDLRELHERGLVSGLSLLSEYEAALEHYERFNGSFYEDDGKLYPVNPPLPRREDFENSELCEPRISPSGIEVTKVGADLLLSLSRSVSELHPDIAQRVQPMISIKYYDSAVREAAIILESRLRDFTKSDEFGIKLVEACYRKLCNGNPNKAAAFFKVLRGELRTIFKFVRNDFAHALHDITHVQCCALLDRISIALEAIDEIEHAR